MQLGIITENNDLYTEVLNTIQRITDRFEVSHLSTLDDIVRVTNEDKSELLIIDTGFKAADFAALTQMIRSRSPRTCMIVIADDSSYAASAYEVHATGYIVKPLTESRLKEELSYYDCWFAEKLHRPDGIQVATENGFEIFINGAPARFKYKKTKQLLAHIISKKGAMVSNDELIRVLWDNKTDELSEKELKSRNSYLRNIEADMKRVLAEEGCEDAVIKHWGEIAIDMDKITFIS